MQNQENMDHQKFENFWQHLMDNCPYELSDDMKPYFKSAMIAANLTGINMENSAVNVPTKKRNSQATGKKKLSSYNVFMKQTMSALKEEGFPNNGRMAEVGARWKKLSPEEKLQFNCETDGSDPSGQKVQKKASGGKKTTGYQLFVKETMPEVKLIEGITHVQRMGKIAEIWKQLGETEKNSYKDRAAQLKISDQSDAS